MKVLDEYHLKDKGDIHIGIEIEMEGEGLPAHFEKWWKTDHDGSLRGHAIEYILRNPCHKNRTKVRLDFLAKALKDSRAKLQPSDRCGVHIHVNCQKMSNEEVMNFAIIYLILENILVKWCGENREGNLFCLRASDADYLISSLVGVKERNSFQHMQHNNYRYASLNFSSLSKYGSLEFRALPAEKSFKRIQLWIEILLSVKDYSLKFKDSFGIIEDISFNGGRNFVQKVLGQKLYDIVSCPNMERELLEGVRQVQQIIYTQYQTRKMSPSSKSGLKKWNRINDLNIVEGQVDINNPQEALKIQAARFRANLPPQAYIELILDPPDEPDDRDRDKPLGE